MNTVTLLGIDIGKNTFHLHGQDARGHQVLRKKLNRNQLLPYQRHRQEHFPPAWTGRQGPSGAA
ncbi:hypothetical protein [Pseudomonas sp. Root329]|uniref:hypothetical protein n=1 Tax=Pseudomonas sp. Root329 TaxID=1736515 RepID=UPI000B02B6A5